jgi:hypothetical protein
MIGPPTAGGRRGDGRGGGGARRQQWEHEGREEHFPTYVCWLGSVLWGDLPSAACAPCLLLPGSTVVLALSIHKLELGVELVKHGRLGQILRDKTRQASL